LPQPRFVLQHDHFALRFRQAGELAHGGPFEFRLVRLAVKPAGGFQLAPGEPISLEVSR